ncbi:hypothetical protein [Octadecabacter ascidiaceicola]|nr:hypothetical protein [Octadecabacter ascidiaceicola]
MNSVNYDAVNDELVINNLPFDGTDGRYDSVAGSETTDANGVRREFYESRQTTTTGLIKHYAVFIDSAFLEATAAAGRDWGNFGNAGANINRSSFNLPLTAETEYRYVGVYAGTRTYDRRSGIELVTGDVTLLLDTADFDPNGNLQGDIAGWVDNRVRVAPGLTGGGPLPRVSLFEVSFDPATGVWDEGVARTFDSDGQTRDNGTYSGLIAGNNGEEMGGYLVMEGVADIQTVSVQTVTYQVGTDAPITVDGLQTTSIEALQALVNSGATLPATLNASVPGGVTIISNEFNNREFRTEYNAREVGVYVGTQVVP